MGELTCTIIKVNTSIPKGQSSKSTLLFLRDMLVAKNLRLQLGALGFDSWQGRGTVWDGRGLLFIE